MASRHHCKLETVCVRSMFPTHDVLPSSLIALGHDPQTNSAEKEHCVEVFVCVCSPTYYNLSHKMKFK